MFESLSYLAVSENTNQFLKLQQHVITLQKALKGTKQRLKPTPLLCTSHKVSQICLPNHQLDMTQRNCMHEKAPRTD